MSEVYYPGDYVKLLSFDGDVDYGTVVRMGTRCNPYDPNHVLVVWDSDGNSLHAGLNQVSLVKKFNKTLDEMSVADLKKFLEKLDDNMYVSGINSLSFHFGKGS